MTISRCSFSLSNSIIPFHTFSRGGVAKCVSGDGRDRNVVSQDVLFIGGRDLWVGPGGVIASSRYGYEGMG
jgi:hypothetical protein